MARSNIIAITLASENEKIQALAWAQEGAPTTVCVRIAPTSDKPSPHWRDFSLNEELSPLKKDAKAGAVAAIHSFFRQKVNNENIEWTIGGVWVTEISAGAESDLDSGTAHPQPLFNQISKKLEGDPPRTTTVANLHKAAEWFVDGPLTSLMKDESLDKYSEPILKASTVTTTLKTEELEEGMLLTNGTLFLPRPTEYGFTDYDLLKTAKDNDQYVLLQGQPGTGKTTLLLAALGEHEQIVCTGDTNRSNFVGRDVRVKGDWITKIGPLPRAMEKGIPLYVDEVAMCDPRELITLFSVMDDRKELTLDEFPDYNDGKPIKAKEGFYIVFATNPDSEGAILSDALMSRMDFEPEYTTDFDLVAKIIGSDHDELITVARSMETMRQNAEVGSALQFRDLVKFKKNHDIYGSKFAMAALVNKIRGESDREVLRDLIHRVMGVGNIPTFRI